MELGITIKVIWSDEDLIEILFSCSNGYFAGHAEIYLSHDKTSELAEALSGFPTSATDSRDLELGTFNPTHADGGAHMRFSCLDSIGHAQVVVKLRGGACKGLGEPESVALRIPVEAAAIDFFVRQLKAMDTASGASAHLTMAK